MVVVEEVAEEGQMHNYSCSQRSCIGVVVDFVGNGHCCKNNFVAFDRKSFDTDTASAVADFDF